MPGASLGCLTVSSDRPFAQRLAHALDSPCTEAILTHFPDGEMDVQWPPGSIPQTAVLAVSLAATESTSLHDRLMQVIFGLHQLKTAGVTRCIGVMPYLGYARSDTKTTPTDLLGLRVVAQHLHQAGLSGVLTVDVHTPAALHNAFPGPTWSVNPVPAMAADLRNHLPPGAPLAVCAPDVGAWKRAQAWAKALATPERESIELAMVHKQRIRPDKVTQDAFTGRVEGRTVIVVDDMISTGGTMAQAVRTCYEHGAHAVWAAATHGLLVDPAPVRLAEVRIKGVLVANTIPEDRVADTPLAERLHVVDVAPTCAEQLDAVLPTGVL